MNLQKNKQSSDSEFKKQRRTLATSESNPYIKGERKIQSPKKSKRKPRPQSAKDQKNLIIASNKRVDLDTKTSVKSEFNDQLVAQPSGTI